MLNVIKSGFLLSFQKWCDSLRNMEQFCNKLEAQTNNKSTELEYEKLITNVLMLFPLKKLKMKPIILTEIVSRLQ